MLGIESPHHGRADVGSIAGVVLVLVLTGCGRGDPVLPVSPIPAADDALGVAYDTGSKELVFELKPVDLPAHAGHHAISQPAPLEGIVPVGGWVNGYHVEVVDAQGNVVPNAIIHHVNIIVPGRRELFSQIMQRLGAAGNETAPVQMPRLIGYPLRAGDRILVSAMLHNPTDQTWQGARVRVRMPHIDDDVLVRPVRVYPFYLDVMPPAGTHDFDLPPGDFEMAWEGQPAVSGRILGLGGHLHKYGTALRLEDVTTGEVVYEAAPILDEAGNVVGMPQDMFFWRFGIPISKDHTYRLVADYSNPTGEMIPAGGMGALGGIMVVSGDEEWPAIDPRDPEFQKDIEVTWRQGGMDMGGMDMGGESADHVHEQPAAAHSH